MCSGLKDAFIVHFATGLPQLDAVMFGPAYDLGSDRGALIVPNRSWITFEPINGVEAVFPEAV